MEKLERHVEVEVKWTPMAIAIGLIMILSLTTVGGFGFFLNEHQRRATDERDIERVEYALSMDQDMLLRVAKSARDKATSPVFVGEAHDSLNNVGGYFGAGGGNLNTALYADSGDVIHKGAITFGVPVYNTTRSP